MATINTFEEFCYNQHDVVCNQKYGDNLPYSFHLKMVRAQAERFIELIPKTVVRNGNMIKGPLHLKDYVLMACAGHDLIEDARLSYNDIAQYAGQEVAEIIFLCTEMRGRNRGERKNAQFYQDLCQNELAVFVKLCDIMANSLYSTLSGSSMLKKQKEEWIGADDNLGIRAKLYEHKEKFKPMFEYLDKIYAL